VAGAQRLRGLLTYVFPFLAVQARLELTRAHLMLTDVTGARTLLPTHLPFTQIAAGLFLSPHTARTQAKSICRKLGVPGRSHDLARARQLGPLGG
jgi:hypothetical protein